MDTNLWDWCIGADSNTATGSGTGRMEDTGLTLLCGNCSITTTVLCSVDTDCLGLPSPPAPIGGNGGTCINPGTNSELVWFDDRADGAVNDLATFSTTQDDEAIYFAAELWVDPDPGSLPLAQVAIDYTDGGLNLWHDPSALVGPITPSMVAPGVCSGSPDRACVRDEDCHFCAISIEPSPPDRPRACGTTELIGDVEVCDDTNINDTCDRTQTCTGIGATLKQGLGLNSSPGIAADLMLIFDFSHWLFFTTSDAVLLMQPGTAIWPGLDPRFNSPWDPVVETATVCPGNPNTDGFCTYEPFVNPGASGGSGGPPGTVEVRIPWDAFGCTGGPPNWNCPGFGPGQDFKFSVMVARGEAAGSYAPAGAIEDVFSEPVAGNSTTTPDNCSAGGIANTICEIADDSTDAFIPADAAIAGGRVATLTMTKGGGNAILNWTPSSCVPTDNDYEVYEGTIGNWYSHVPAVIPAGMCTTAGATTAPVGLGAGNANEYYLIVPTDGNVEGSYGDSRNPAPAERPQNAGFCKAQSLGVCP